KFSAEFFAGFTRKIEKLGMIRWKTGKNGGAVFGGRSGNLCLLTSQFGLFYPVSKPYLHGNLA
ncbi:MAG: hypothetical protein SPI18_03515, partial [Prevotella sp.]|nr:hypothetical protein [Prevotella sp.]